jgi:alpha-L-glutamate ligase-like protein
MNTCQVLVGKREDRFEKGSGDELSLADIKRHLTNIVSGLHSLGGRTDVAIIEDLVVSPIFDKFSYEGVPDIRLIVFKGYPVMGMLRLATRASDGKANLHQGAVGVGLDIATGRAVAAVQYNRPVTHHPDTGADLSTIEVPGWRSLLLLAARCYDVTLLGYLGCDIVIDQNKGALLLELNARPGLSIQIANNAGLVPRLREVEAADHFTPSMEARVEYSISKFGARPPSETPSSVTPGAAS